MPAPFYVYTLADETGTVFYVGKGCRTSSNEERMHAHEKDARRGKRSRVCHRIRAIWTRGGRVAAMKIFVSSSATEAYIREAEEITRVGLDNLCNLVPGGRGGTEGNRNARGLRTEEQKARVRAGVRAYLERLTVSGGRRSCSPATASKIGKANAMRMRGRILPASVREKISQSLLGNQRMAGKAMSMAARLKIASALRGKPHAIAHTEKVSAALRGRRQTREECALRSRLLKGKPWSAARRAASVKVEE